MIGISAAVMMLAAGCAASPDQEPVPSSAMPGTYVFMCPDGYRFSATARANEALLDLETRNPTLPRVEAASGARYSDGELVFWNQGHEAMLESASEEHTGCVGEAANTPEDLSRLRGKEYRAVGQEPGWLLEIDDDGFVRFLYDYGERRMIVPYAEPEQRVDGGWTYEIVTEASELRIEIRPEPCNDGMSGKPYPHTVEVIANGERYGGCGEPLDG